MQSAGSTVGKKVARGKAVRAGAEAGAGAGDTPPRIKNGTQGSRGSWMPLGKLKPSHDSFRCTYEHPVLAFPLKTEENIYRPSIVFVIDSS
jgi:hypothetical protein